MSFALSGGDSHGRSPLLSAETSSQVRGLKVDESADTPGMEPAPSLRADRGAPSLLPEQTCYWHCWVRWLDRALLGDVADLVRTRCTDPTRWLRKCDPSR